MKKLALALSLVTGLAAGVYADGGDLGSQGSLTSSPYPNNIGSFTFDNGDNYNTSKTATSGGLAWIGSSIATATLLNQDVNMSLSDGSGLIVKLLLSDGTASGISWGGGEFVDPYVGVYYILGVPGGGTVTVRLDAWTGSETSYTAALSDPNDYVGSVTFNLVTGNYTTGGLPPSFPPDFAAMPALVMYGTPEPATLALMGLGGLSLMLFRRKT